MSLNGHDTEKHPKSEVEMDRECVASCLSVLGCDEFEIEVRQCIAQ
jgi:hypothetical protein